MGVRSYCKFGTLILDFPSDNGLPVADDIPCNICSMLKVRNGRLEWSQIMRSNDIFLGLPHNFVQFMTLQEVLAGWIGIEPGTYTHFADSLHLYEKNAERRLFIHPGAHDPDFGLFSTSQAMRPIRFGMR